MNPPSDHHVEVPAAVEALARFEFDRLERGSLGAGQPWEKCEPAVRDELLKWAREALQAAAPSIRAPLEAEVKKLREDLDEARDARFEEGCDECENRRETERLRADRAEAERDDARYSPMGDNHHNAAACPYCRPEMEADRQQAAQQERKRIEAALKATPAVKAAEAAARQRIDDGGCSCADCAAAAAGWGLSAALATLKEEDH